MSTLGSTDEFPEWFVHMDGQEQLFANGDMARDAAQRWAGHYPGSVVTLCRVTVVGRCKAKSKPVEWTVAAPKP